MQEPPKYDGKSSWEVFLVQFEIAAILNGWNDEQKALFLATFPSRKRDPDPEQYLMK